MDIDQEDTWKAAGTELPGLQTGSPRMHLAYILGSSTLTWS